MDSIGLDTLLDARDRCQSLGGSFVLANPNPLCRDILRINGIDREVNVYDDVVKALGSFAR
jgi:anti-anti-sigma factor